MFKLYVYDHCPYCTRARMIFGYKNVDLDLRYLLNDDEDSHMEKIGQKMVPILQKHDGSYMAESADIVHYIDALDGSKILIDDQSSEITDWLAQTGETVRRLCMPRWCLTDMPEFKTASARAYFMIKKEQSIGAFGENIAQTNDLKKQMQAYLQKLESLLNKGSFIHGAQPSFDDIMLFAHLRSLTIVKGLRWPQKVRQYLAVQSELTNIWLFDAYAF